MATAEFQATVGSVNASASTANLVGSVVTGQVAAKSDGTHGAAFTAALATLVADGASPTQAHVTAANNAWTSYKADIDAQTTAIAALTADISLYIGSVSNVSDMNKLRNALRMIVAAVSGTGILATGSGSPRSI